MLGVDPILVGKLCISCQRGASLHVSFAETLSCSYVLGTPGRCRADCRSRARAGIREKPKTFANRRTAQTRGEVIVFGAFVAAVADRPRRSGDARVDPSGQPSASVRRIVQEPLASLSRDDVDDGALNIAVFGGRAD